jgi:RNA 2',3'-cyclic 3'-phosphodiesterase
MTDMDKNIRAFLAVVPPEDILQAMSALQEKFKNEINGRISWTKPQSQHLTLKFFGDISPEDVKNISTAAQNQIAEVPALNLKVEKIGVFPDVRRPRVIWCGVAGDVQKLTELQKQLDNDFAGIGFPKEDRPFRAHLTLGRIKDAHGLTGISEALDKHSDFAAGDFSCKGLILFQSKLTSQGALYSKLAEFALCGQ